MPVVVNFKFKQDHVMTYCPFTNEILMNTDGFVQLTEWPGFCNMVIDCTEKSDTMVNRDLSSN